MSHLGDHLRARREALGLSRPDIARRLGYKNLGKGCRRVVELERDGDGPPGFPEAVAGLLGIDPPAVAALAARDREDAVRAWNEWADQPVPVEIVVRAVPGVFGRVPVPDGLTDPDEVVAHARGLARRWKKVVVVVLSRRKSVTIDEGGVISRNVATPDRDIRPGMWPGRRPAPGRRFVLRVLPDGSIGPPSGLAGEE